MLCLYNSYTNTKRCTFGKKNMFKVCKERNMFEVIFSHLKTGKRLILFVIIFVFLEPKLITTKHKINKIQIIIVYGAEN